MRLNRYIAQAGLTSRRGADDLIRQGQVQINGVTVEKLGCQVQPDDRVTVAGKELPPPEELVYYALNKPPGYITTTADEQNRPTALSLLMDVSQRVYPVGRLDADTSGLLLFTNDGELTQRLTHPSHRVAKTYQVRVRGGVSQAALETLRAGVDIGGYRTAPAQVDLLEAGENQTLLQIIIREGKNRQVRRMCQAVGHPVLGLRRTAVDGLLLGRLKEGHYRKLTPAEVATLKQSGGYAQMPSSSSRA